MNNTTFSFNKKQIVQSVLEPDTHSIWLNSNDNKLYKFGNSGWEPVGGTNIYRIFLVSSSKAGYLMLDPNHEKENTIARRAFNEDWKTYTNNIYLITLNDFDYGELTGVANCYSKESLITDFTIGIVKDSKTGECALSKGIIYVDGDQFKDLTIPNTDIIFRIEVVSIQATSIR